MRKYIGTRDDGSTYEMDLEDIFDQSIPDVVVPIPTIEIRIEDGKEIKVMNHHYNPQANHFKVREDIWNHFNDTGKAVINNNMGGSNTEVLYQHWSSKMTLSEWMELKMWILTQSLWYIEEFTKKD